jgi:hypothetical protein
MYLYGNVTLVNNGLLSLSFSVIVVPSPLFKGSDASSLERECGLLSSLRRDALRVHAQSYLDAQALADLSLFN